MDRGLLILTKYTDFSLFVPKMKVHRSNEVPEYTEINRKAARDIEFTSKMDPSRLKYILVTMNWLIEQ